MRDWLALIIVILILGILIDGVRRMRIARREQLVLSKNAQNADKLEGEGADNETFSSEFPSGKARVAKQRDEESAEALNQSVRRKYSDGRVTLGAPQRIPEQVTLNLEESVPMLMDSVDYEPSPQESDDHTVNEPVISEGYGDEAKNIEGNSVERHTGEAIIEPTVGSLDEVLESSDADNLYASESRSDDSSPVDTEATVMEKNAADHDADIEYREPDEVLIINVMARAGERFSGSALLEILTRLGLKLGAMEIFHRHENNDGDGEVLYSLANMVVPGTFNLAEMENFVTPGISLFLSLPIASDSLHAYDDMVLSARALAEGLGGELKDENRSVMTNQTIEHGRERVIEYERKKKLTLTKGLS